MAQFNSLLVTGDSRFINPINGNARNGIYYVKGTQTAATGSWTGNIAVPALYDGLTISYYLPYGGSGNATLNLTLSDGTTTGAVNCYYQGNSRLTTHYGAGSNIMLTYHPAGAVSVNGTATTDNRWVAGQNYADGNDTSYYDRVIYVYAKAGSNKIFPYTIVCQLPDGRWESIVTSSSTGTGKSRNSHGFLFGQIGLMYANATYNENVLIDNYNFWWRYSGVIDHRYSFNTANNSTSGLTSQQRVYLVGSIGNDGLFYLDATKWWTQTLPSTADGKIYIYIGNCYDYYRMTFDGKLKAYVYTNGHIREYCQDAATVGGHTVAKDVPSNALFTDNNTTYTFANGTNGFTVTPSGGTAQTVTVTPSITNNVTGSGTSGYLTKFNGAHTITNGPQLGSSTTTFLRNDGTWATPSTGTDTKNTAGSTNNTGKLYLVGALEQSANPQTYSNSNVYVQNNTVYTKGANAVNSNGITVSALVIDSNQNGQFNVWKADGTPMVWATGSSGQLNCMGAITAIEKVNGANKRRVRHEADTTDHFGKTTWYQGDNIPRVIIQGSNYYEETTPPEGENKNISLLNEDGVETIYMNSTYGKIYCNEIEFAVTSGTSRFVKSSGSWTFKECSWQRFGNVVTVNIQFKGGSSNVSVGSNSIVGTITDIPKPPFTVRLEGYYSGTVLMGELTDTGGFNVRILGQALNLNSANTATMSGTYVLDHTLES